MVDGSPQSPVLLVLYITSTFGTEEGEINSRLVVSRVTGVAFSVQAVDGRGLEVDTEVCGIIE